MRNRKQFNLYFVKKKTACQDPETAGGSLICKAGAGRAAEQDRQVWQNIPSNPGGGGHIAQPSWSPCPSWVPVPGWAVPAALVAPLLDVTCDIQLLAAHSFAHSASEASDADWITHMWTNSHSEGPGSGVPESWAQNWCTGSPAFLLTLPKKPAILNPWLFYHQALCNHWQNWFEELL